MSRDPDRRYLGRTMGDHWEWAKDNITALAFRGADEIARVVKIARDETRSLTAIIEFFLPLGVMLVTWRLMAETGADHDDFTGELIVSVLAGVVCTVIAQYVCLLLFRRKIASIARFTYSSPYA